MPLRARQALDFVRLGRPHFLLAGFLFFGLGVLLARGDGHRIGALAYVLGQTFVTLTQWGVHYANDFHDLAADRANPKATRFAGGSGILAEGRLPPGVSAWTARALYSLGTVAAAAIALRHGWGAAALAGAILAISWAYSAPPFRLHSTGSGEIAAGLVVAALVPWLGFLVSRGDPSPALAAHLAPGALATVVVVMVLSLPDREGDEAAGKRTLAVRLGETRTLRACQTVLVAAAAILAAEVGAGAWGWLGLGAVSLLTLAIALPGMVRTRRWDAAAVSSAGVAALLAALQGAAAVVR